eukprot:3956776-Pyramimonas_sp.AAC.1
MQEVKNDGAQAVDRTHGGAPPSVKVLEEWQLDAPFDSVEDAAALRFKAAEKYLVQLFEIPPSDKRMYTGREKGAVLKQKRLVDCAKSILERHDESDT